MTAQERIERINALCQPTRYPRAETWRWRGKPNPWHRAANELRKEARAIEAEHPLLAEACRELAEHLRLLWRGNAAKEREADARQFHALAEGAEPAVANQLRTRARKARARAMALAPTTKSDFQASAECWVRAQRLMKLALK